MISKGVEDEVFFMREKGIVITIYSLVDAINQSYDESFIKFYPTNVLMKTRRSGKVDHGPVMKMSKERMNEPLIATVLFEENWIIDGNHRLFKRCQEKLPETGVIIISEDEIKNFIEPF